MAHTVVRSRQETGVTQGASEPVVVLAYQHSRMDSQPGPNYRRLLESDYGWRGVDPLTGRTIWSTSAQQFPLTGVFGSVFVGRYDERAHSVDLYDAMTGKPLHPQRKADLDRIRASARAYGSNLALVADGVLNLNTGSFRSVTMPPYPVHSWLDSPRNSRIVAYIDTDDGGVGHSVWPKYLYCCDLSGRKLWQYPRRIRCSDQSSASAANSVHAAMYVPSAGVVIADMNTAIRVSDGRVLWRRPLPGMRTIDLVPYRRGAFLLARPAKSEGYPSLAYIDALTGKHRWLARLPSAERLYADEDHLYVGTGRDRLSAYDATDLLTGGGM